VSRWRFFYHVVWATKSRVPAIGQLEDVEIRRSLQLTSEDLDLIPHAIGVMPDHVHFAVSIPPKLAVAEVIRKLKGGSSHAVNEARGMSYPRFWWQPDYGAITFGEGSLERVITYLRKQAEHHAELSLWDALELTDEK
jgi:putative transposase